MNNQKTQTNKQGTKARTRQATQQEAQQGRQTQPPNIPVNDMIQEFRIGYPDMFPQIDESKSYPTIQEFLETVDILNYETYVGELNTKDKDEYWSVQGIDHFSADLGIGVCELVIYDLKDVWLILAHARCVTDNRPSCAAVTHDKKDRHSLEKAVRRAGRNARQYMIPLALLSDKLEKAKAKRDSDIQLAADIKAASDKAGKAMRENRDNFSGITDVPTLLSFVEEKVGRVRKEWIVTDWNFLTAGVSDPKSLFLKELSEYVGLEPTEYEENPEEESEEESEKEDEEVTENPEEDDKDQDWEAVAESIEESK